MKTKDTKEKIESIENNLKKIQHSLKREINVDHSPSTLNEEVSDNYNLETFENEQAEYLERLKCDYCDFIGKSEGGLKTHMRSKHTKILNQLDWKHCTFCNFNSKTESEIKTHMTHYRVTHSQTKNKNVFELKSELLEMSENGFILYSFDSAETQEQYLQQLEKNSRKTVSYNGKSPR